MFWTVIGSGVVRRRGPGSGDVWRISSICGPRGRIGFGSGATCANGAVTGVRREAGQLVRCASGC
eukprot:scaffold299_cov343-Prasinococcus_capsulatus_cf.AAC.7